MSACLFAGPTLPPRDAARTPDAIWLPPAQHGDVFRAVTLLRPQAIGLVDGYFQWVPSVWHKEILWAIDQGVHVFGAASMGALRAAELAPFGMRGVGRIFEAYRDGVLAGGGDEPFEDDDEVAVIHGPAESGYIAASEAMVNIRCTLAAAERAGLVSGATRGQLVAIAKAQFYAERSYDLLLRCGRAQELPARELTALQAWLPTGRIDQKRADAVAMIQTMRDFLATDPAPACAGFAFEHTTLWHRAVADLEPVALHDADEAHALEELRLTGARLEKLRREVLHALTGAAETPASARATTEQAASRAVGEDAGQRLAAAERLEALRRAQERLPGAIVERQLLARLRATGEYARLVQRARDKRAWLSERRGLPHVEEFSELQLLQLRDWYFSQALGTDMPDDLGEYLRTAGYPDPLCFHEAVFAEYLYRQKSSDNVAAEAATGGS